MKIRKSILRNFGIGVVFILLGIILQYFYPSLQTILPGINIFIFTGLLMFIFGIMAARKPENAVTPDERSVRNQEKAGHNAFWVLLMTMAVWLGVDILWSLNHVTAMAGVTAIIFIGINIFLILIFYYDKKGG